MSYEPSFIRDVCVLVPVFAVLFGIGCWFGWRYAMHRIRIRVIEVAGRAHQDGYQQGFKDCANCVVAIEVPEREIDNSPA